MMRKLRKIMDRPLVQDTLGFFGGLTGKGGRGIRREDGRPVSVEDIMRTFGVQKNVAEQIYKRRSK